VVISNFKLFLCVMLHGKACQTKLRLYIQYISFLQFRLLLIFRLRNLVVSISMLVLLSEPIFELRVILLLVAGIIPLVLSKRNVSLRTLNHLSD
jgi:hypothetical protein